jgi:hypothetical protein
MNELDQSATVTISNNRYKELLEKENSLLALEAGGVSSWEWYEQSLKDYRYTMDDLEILRAAATKEWGHKGHWIANEGKYIWTWASNVNSIGLSFTATFLSENDLGIKVWSVFLNGEDECTESSHDLELLFHNLKVDLISSLIEKFEVEEDIMNITRS